MIIDWQVIPHSEQKYETCGNWWWGDMKDTVVRTLYIRVSNLSKPVYEWLIGIHELIEAFLSDFAGVRTDDIDAFDWGFEQRRALLLKGSLGDWKILQCGCMLKFERAEEYEPGNDTHAPYYRQHQIASVCERALALFLGVNWAEYEAEVQSLTQKARIALTR